MMVEVLRCTWSKILCSALVFAFCFGEAKGESTELAVASLQKNADSVGRYEKLEVTVSLINLDYKNPYDPKEVDLSAVFTAPSGKKWPVFGFYDGKEWKVRFAPNEIGNWTGRITVLNKKREARSNEFTFTCAASSHHGWIHVSKVDPHYFVHDDGTPWYGVGHCDADQIGNDIPLEEVSKHKLNVLVHWMFSSRPIESEGKGTENSGLGAYDQTNCRWIDELVDRCEELDIKLIWILWFHSQFYNRWSYGWDKGVRRNAYHGLKGGKLKANEWASDPMSLAYQDRFHRYVIARWGYSRAVGMWDLLCEINLARQKNVEAWLTRTQEYFHKNDPYGRPTSVGGSGEKWLPREYKIIDSPNYHSYKEQPVGKWVGHLVDRTRAMRAFGKPSYIGEYGTADPKKRLEFMHKTNWACTAAGAALTPLYWIHGDRYYKEHAGMSPEEYLKHQGILADFVKDIPFGVEKLYPIPTKDIAINKLRSREAQAVAVAEGVDVPFDFTVMAGGKWNVKHARPPLIISGPKKGPLGEEVNVHVMGRAHSEMKSPLVFGLKCAKDAKLVLHVESTNKEGSHLIVFVDGKMVLQEKFAFESKRKKGKWASTVDKDIAISIPPGIHAIRIENHGSDWVRIDRYRFSNLLKPTEKDMAILNVKAAGATSEINILGMRGKGFAFLYVMEPTLVHGKKLSIANMTDGVYEVEWWNTWTGKVIATYEVKVTGGALLLKIPESKRDMACKMRRKKDPKALEKTGASK